MKQLCEMLEIPGGSLDVTVEVIPGTPAPDAGVDRLMRFASSGLHLCILQRAKALDCALTQGETAVTQESSYERLGHTITVRACLAYHKANLETALAEMLAYAMLDMHTLPDLLDRFIREEAAQWARPTSVHPTASSQAGFAGIRYGISSRPFVPLDPPRVSAQLVAPADARATSMAQHPSAQLRVVPPLGSNGL